MIFICDQIDKDALDRQVQEKKILRDQEQAKQQAYSNKLLQDCATSLQLDEQNKKVNIQYFKFLSIIIVRLSRKKTSTELNIFKKICVQIMYNFVISTLIFCC